MPDLILNEVTGHHVRLHVTDSPVSKGVRPAWGDTKNFAERLLSRLAIAR